MSGIELMDKHPLSTTKLKKWLIAKVMDSILENNEMPEQFKEFVLSSFETNEQLGDIYEDNAASLFEFFDSYSIFIQIVKGVGTDWFAVLQGETSDVCGSRKKANRVALETAFPILEKLLTPSPIQSLDSN